MKRTLLGILLVGVGIAVGAAMSYVATPDKEKMAQGREAPLYWVAPMDANYRRDAPGKSPMGMDLIPVFASDLADRGTVRISPTVAHNMGVRTAIIERGRLRDSIQTVAFVQVDEDQVSHVFPRVEGWVIKLHVTSVGEHIAEGASLFDIYSPALVTAQEELISAMASGNKFLVASTKDRLRALEIPDRLIAQLEKDRTVHQNVTITAKHSGVVTSLAVREGHFVKPGAQVMEIANLDSIWVTAEVFEREAGDVEKGDGITLKFANRAEPVRASVDFVYPLLDAVTRTLSVRATVANPDGALMPNMLADASIDVAHEGEQLLAPRDAVIRTGVQDRVVLAMNDDAYKSVVVKLGRSGDEYVEIIDGLNEGDRIVTSAQFLIDSESSTTSDFMRMDMAQVTDDEMDHSAMGHVSDTPMPMNDERKSALTIATILSVDIQARTIRLTHDPIPSWGWPSMTMTINVAAGEDIESISRQGRYNLRISESPDTASGYEVSEISPTTETRAH